MKSRFIILILIFCEEMSLFNLGAQNQLANDSLIIISCGGLSTGSSIDTLTLPIPNNDSLIDILQTYDPRWITLYEYGEQLTNCECNFENLFRNWTPQFISNSPEIQLLSYRYVETISDSDRINYYYNLLTDLNTLVGFKGEHFTQSGSKEMVTTEKTRYIKIISRKDSYLNSSMFDLKTEKEKKEYLENVKREEGKMLRFTGRSIRTGYRIYLIKFSIEGKIYDNYVVCDPRKNRILWDNIFGGAFAKKNIKLYD